MTIVKFLSYFGIGASAVSPFSLLIFSQGNETAPVFEEKLFPMNGSKNIETSPTLFKVSQTPDSAEQDVPKHLLTQRGYVKSPSVIKVFGKENKLSRDVRGEELPTKDIEDVPLEANLSEWLNTINPAISENDLIFIARWESWYFRLVRWDSDCKCFLELDEDYGIWTNRNGWFTIGKKYDDPQKTVTPLSDLQEDSKCVAFNSFWWQNWDTWLKSFAGDKESNKALTSCYKKPVFFLDNNKLVPLFTRYRGNITPLVSMDYLYDYKTKQFVVNRKGVVPTKNTFRLRNYTDWIRLWEINK